MSEAYNSFLFAPEAQFSRITRDEAAPIINRYHYSKNVPAGFNLYFGWFAETLLYAVAIYGIGVNNNAADFLAKETGKTVNSSNLIELKRLARIEPKREDMPLTKFLSQCHKQLKKLGYSYVVSYSDPQYNPAGGIYAAANFKHLGMTGEETDILGPTGLKINRRTLLHWRENAGRKLHSDGTIPTIEEACAALGYQKVTTPPKKRWFLAL